MIQNIHVLRTVTGCNHRDGTHQKQAANGLEAKLTFWGNCWTTVWRNSLWGISRGLFRENFLERAFSWGKCRRGIVQVGCLNIQAGLQVSTCSGCDLGHQG